VFALFTIVGFLSPFVLALCYVWIDILKPQSIAFGWMQDAPLSLLAAILAIVSYCLFDRGRPEKIIFLHILLIIWAIWLTVTTTWAVLPTFAWQQWNLAIKTILFSAFIPFVIRTRTQIDAFIFFLFLVPAVAILPAAIKTLITGGGYG